MGLYFGEFSNGRVFEATQPLDRFLAMPIDLPTSFIDRTLNNLRQAWSGLSDSTRHMLSGMPEAGSSRRGSGARPSTDGDLSDSARR